ncbi:HNH endonuclease signature motif containing protein [Chroococcidiopsis sp.]|uniref:HNH endonuclease signature motif containing protein n=1 Tax=Chroococcidiopsis sp. TaxID=3088168 RepID=UPI003F37F4D7
MISEKLLQRVWSRAEDLNDCKIWKGQVKSGAPIFSTLAKHGLSSDVAKAMYQVKKGSIPDGMTIAHSCKNRLCINVNHIELIPVPTSDDRFLSKIDKTPGLGTGDCWDWLGCCFSDGYSAFVPEHGKTVRAHRYSYELFVGAIPEGMVILHFCDRPTCVNPKHLSIGTGFDNMQDMVKKVRGMQGERCHLSKLTKADVIRIKKFLKEGVMTQVAIASMFKVTPTIISSIKKGKIWKHID